MVSQDAIKIGVGLFILEFSAKLKKAKTPGSISLMFCLLMIISNRIQWHLGGSWTVPVLVGGNRCQTANL